MLREEGNVYSNFAEITLMYSVLILKDKTRFKYRVRPVPTVSQNELVSGMQPCTAFRVTR